VLFIGWVAQTRQKALVARSAIHPSGAITGSPI
jgi:hypothetical protein